MKTNELANNLNGDCTPFVTQIGKGNILTNISFTWSLAITWNKRVSSTCTWSNLTWGWSSRWRRGREGDKFTEYLCLNIPRSSLAVIHWLHVQLWCEETVWVVQFWVLTVKSAVLACGHFYRSFVWGGNRHIAKDFILYSNFCLCLQVFNWKKTKSEMAIEKKETLYSVTTKWMQRKTNPNVRFFRKMSVKFTKCLMGVNKPKKHEVDTNDYVLNIKSFYAINCFLSIKL